MAHFFFSCTIMKMKKIIEIFMPANSHSNSSYTIYFLFCPFMLLNELCQCKSKSLTFCFEDVIYDHLLFRLFEINLKIAYAYQIMSLSLLNSDKKLSLKYD